MTDQQIQKVAAGILVAFAFVAVYAILAVAGYLPAAPWSPIGQERAQQEQSANV